MKKHHQLLLASLIGCSLNAAEASTLYGTLSNFDVFNDSTSNYYGFEIEMEGLDISDVAGYNGSYYTYPSFSYGEGQVISANDPNTSTLRTLVRYFNGGANSTLPFVGSISPTDGHTCIQTQGCEHFGVALNGTPSTTRYYWLDQAGSRATQVNLIGMPVITVVPQGPAQQPVVQMEIGIAPPDAEAPEPPEGIKFSDAVWVKIMKTELDSEHMADLDDLMAHNKDKIADESDENAVEVEWKILQRRLDKPDDQQNKFKLEAQAGENAEQVLRTYQFYAFTGGYSEEHEAICDGTEGDCENAIADFLLQNPGQVPGYIGKLLGQQMVAVNLNGPVNVPQVPVPGAVWLFGSALAGLFGFMRRKNRL
jgi:hypothetical protein